MVYDKNIGIAYDTVFYGVLYFNFERVSRHFAETYGVSSEDFKHYFALKEIIPEPSKDIYPFFYNDISKMSFISDYFANNYNFTNCSSELFFNEIVISKIAFRNAFFGFYLGISVDNSMFEKQNAFSLVEKVTQLDLDEAVVMQLVRLLIDFDTIYDNLITFLKDTYVSVEILHEQQEINKQALLKIFQTDNFISRVNILKISDKLEKSDISSISICLVHIIVVWLKETWTNDKILVLGEHCSKNVSYYLKDTSFEIKLLFEAMADPVRFEILSKLKENEYTTTQLAEILFVSRQAVSRHVLWLFEHMFIAVSMIKWPEKYYKVNVDYFKTAKNNAYQFLNTFDGENP